MKERDETDHSRQLSSLEGHEVEEVLSVLALMGGLMPRDARFGGMSAILSVPLVGYAVIDRGYGLDWICLY